MNIMLNAWRPNVNSHQWVMPDRHHVKCNVTEVKSHNIPMGDSGLTFGYRAEVSVVKRKGISLPANIVHSIDAYIAREMVRRANKQGFELLTIHDSFQ